MPDLCIKCPIKNCARSYKSVGSVRNHVSMKHKVLLKKVIVNSNCDHSDNDDFNLSDVDNNPLQNELDECEPGEPGPSSSGDIDNESNELSKIPSIHSSVDKQIKLFLLNLRTKKYVSENSTELIIQNFEQLLTNCTDQISYQVNNLQDKVTPEEKVNICQPLNDLVSTLNNYNTSYKQSMKLQEENYVEPVEISFNSGKKSVYVPLLESLKLLLSHEDILAYVLQGDTPSNMSSSGNIVKDFLSGQKAAGSAFFSGAPVKLQIQLYFDDYTLTNPLASSSKKHKICAVYYQLGNIPHCFRSKLYTIQLLSLTNSAVVKEFGFGVVFNQLLQDLKILESDGISISYENRCYNFLGSVSTLVADNLAAHEVGGLVCSFSGFRICRFCNATKTNSKHLFSENQFSLRSIESYNAQLELVEQNPELSSVYGLKFNSFLNDLNFFHVCWGSPSDIAHDLFEGVCLDLISTILEFYISRRDIKLDLTLINKIIRNFAYFGKEKRNKPEKLCSKGNKIIIRQTASQCLNLVKLLPLMISSYIPTDCKYWSCYISFLNCLDYILAPSLSHGQIEYMSDLITEFLHSYSTLSEDINIKPKDHYMIHFPTQYRYFGPLINQSTIRYEGKHSNLKSLFGNCKNFRNPCLSIAKRHQSLQALHHFHTNFLKSDEIYTSKSKENPVPFDSLPPELRTVFVDVNSEEPFEFLKKITCNGIIYEEKGIVVSGFDYENQYHFGQIHSVVFVNEVPYLIIENLDTVEYSQHEHCYLLCSKETKVYERLMVKSLLSSHVISPHYCERGILAMMPHFISY